MAQYYNTTRGSIAVALRDGKSACFLAKQWTAVATEDEGSEDLIRAVKKGFLVRFADDAVVAEKTVEPVVPVMPLASVAPVAPVVAEAALVPAAASDDAGPVSRKKR